MAISRWRDNSNWYIYHGKEGCVCQYIDGTKAIYHYGENKRKFIRNNFSSIKNEKDIKDLLDCLFIANKET